MAREVGIKSKLKLISLITVILFVQVITINVVFAESNEKMQEGAMLEIEEDALVAIEEPIVPLASGGAEEWAMVNTIFLLTIAGIGILRIKKKRDKYVDIYIDAEEEKKDLISKIISGGIILGSIAIYIITQNIGGQLVSTDKWTMLFLLLAVMQIYILIKKSKVSKA